MNFNKNDNNDDGDDNDNINKQQSNTSTNNDIRDIIFSNSPLDQYLQSLNENDSNNNYLEGEVLSFEDFNQENIEQIENQEKIDEAEIENSKENVKSSRKNNSTKSTSDAASNSNFSELKLYFLSLYQNISTTIIKSDLLHPHESPFIQNPNLTLDYNIHNYEDSINQVEEEDEEYNNDQLPPIYPLSLLNISINNNNNNNNNSSSGISNKIYKFQLFKFLNNLNNNILIILSSILIITISILYLIINPITLMTLMSLIIITIILINKYINSQIQIINQKSEIVNTQIKSLIETGSLHYDNLMKSIQLIREVELISRGYRLSTPLTPIERLEINIPLNNNNNSKSEKSFILRAGVSKSLRTSIRLFKDIIDNNISTNLSSKQKRLFIKSTLSDLYNNIELINNNNSVNNDNNNNNNNNNNDIIDNELLIMEYCSQLPIITLKMMLHQYQLMISNFFTILIIFTSNIFYNNNNDNKNNNNNNILYNLLSNYINNKNYNSCSSNNFDLKIFFNLNKIIKTLNNLESNLYNLNSRLSIENNSIKSLISKELWENKIPKRVLISKPKKTIVESFIFSTNQIAESLNSISPLFTSLHEKIKPFESSSSIINNENEENEESISIIDILKLDEVVNDFIKVKSELNQCLKNWESANRSLVKMVRSIPTNNPNLQSKWTEEEANEKLKKLLERLKSHISSHSELIADEDNQLNNNNNNIGNRIRDINMNSNNDEWQFYEDIGDLDVYIEKAIPTPPPPPPLNNENIETLSSTSNPPPPPPPPAKGLPRRTKPPKRTVYDPDFDPITQTMKSKSSQNQERSNISNNDSNLSSIIPQKKVITELRSVLDIHISKKNLPV